MADREKVIAGLTMLTDRANDDTCVGLKCCKIAEDALVLLKKQPEIVLCKDCKYGTIVAQYGMLPFVTCKGVDHELDWFCADGRKRCD